LGCLLVEFLELYGLDMNYLTTGISVRHDGFYFPKGARDRREVYGSTNPSRTFALAMENPLDPTMDVGKASFKMQLIQRSFDTAFKVLLAHVAEPAIPAPSILLSILPASSEMYVTRQKTEKKELKILLVGLIVGSR
jgi:non-canonical poly(A) RNA polymerase PAPD5/7